MKGDHKNTRQSSKASLYPMILVREGRMIHGCKEPIHIWDKQGLKHNAPCMFAACGSSLVGHHTACEKFRARFLKGWLALIQDYALPRITFCVIIFFFRCKGTTEFCKPELNVLRQENLLKIWLNPGINLTMFRGTGIYPCRFLYNETIPFLWHSV